MYKESLKMLNPQQLKAVETIDGPVFVNAGPGTGKTQILTLRIAHIIEQMGADYADSIVALTFTNAAVRSMKERLAQFTNHETAARVGIFTFHSFAQHIIQSYPEYFKDRSRFILASDLERYEIVQSILTNDIEFGVLKPLYDEYFYLQAVISSLSVIKREGYSPDEFSELVERSYEDSLQDESLQYKKDGKFGKKGEVRKSELLKINKNRDKQRELAKIYELYQDKLEEKKYFDYTDLLLVVNKELSENDELRMVLQEKYQYILVDEHQDTNNAQIQLLQQLIDNPVWEGKPNIFTVGDAKQSIFSFAGATNSSFSAIETMVQEETHIFLQDNYRSGQHVLDESYSLITESEEHKDESTLSSFFKHEGDIEVYEFSNYKFELVWIAQKIKALIESGVDENEIAVLFRKNSQANIIRGALQHLGVAVRDYSKRNVLDEPHINKLFHLCRSLDDLEDNVHLSRVLYASFLGIDPHAVSKVLRKIRSNRKDTRKSIYSIISSEKELKDLDIDIPTRKQFANFAQMLATAKIKSENDPIPDVFTYILRESGVLAHAITANDSVQALTAIDALYDEIKKEYGANPQFSLKDFNSLIELMKERGMRIDIPPTTSQGVTLTTFHGSKGLEFEHVFLYHTLSGNAPSRLITLPFDASGSYIEEERRLFFVALTRAKKHLYITYPRLSVDGKEVLPVSFVQDREHILYVDTSGFELQSAPVVTQFLQESSYEPLSLASHEYIRDRFLSRPLSVSALNNFMDSPVLYYFRNLILLPEPLSDTLEFGNCIHYILEQFFKESIRTKSIPDWEMMQQITEKTTSDLARWNKFTVRALSTMKGYFDEHHEHMVVPDEVEFPIFGATFTHREHTIQLTGRIDKIERGEHGEVVVVDYKTGRSYSEQSGSKKEKEKRRSKIERQAVFYALLLDEYRGGMYRTRTAVFDYIEETEKSGYERHMVTITDEMIETLRDEIRSMIDTVTSKDFINSIIMNDDLNDSYKELFDLISESIHSEE